eukprot:1138207-Pelagomonas_calceolata.AAC.4
MQKEQGRVDLCMLAHPLVVAAQDACGCWAGLRHWVQRSAHPRYGLPWLVAGHRDLAAVVRAACEGSQGQACNYRGLEVAQSDQGAGLEYE